MSEPDVDGFPLESARMLFRAWIAKLSEERLGFPPGYSWGGEHDGTRVFTFGQETESPFTIIARDEHMELGELGSLDRAVVDKILSDAADRVSERDSGDPVVYMTQYKTTEMDQLGPVKVQSMRRIADSVPIEGARRLGSVVVLDFSESSPPVHGLVFSDATIDAAIFATGPTPGELSGTTAVSVAELTAAVIALALGRPVTFTLPFFPVDEASALPALARRLDPNIRGLARNSVSLDVFDELNRLGGPEAQLRLRGSLLAYHAALHQQSADVATMLFVTAIESLFAPYGAWGKSGLVARFVKVLIELCPTAIDEILSHPNVESVFSIKLKGGVRERRRRLLREIYERRSGPTHGGLVPTMNAVWSPAYLQVSFLSGLARSAILHFIGAPRCWLYGHPQHSSTKSPDEQHLAHHCPDPASCDWPGLGRR